MEKVILSAILTTIVTFNLSNGDKTNIFEVKKRLENGDILPEDQWSKFEIFCPSTGDLSLNVNTQSEISAVKVYMANEKKNLLLLDVSGERLVGYKYETPYGANEKLMGPVITRESEGKIITRIPRKWIPKKVTRVSASIETESDTYNYYGIFNRPISFKDTMVVEEFRKVVLC